MHILGIHLDPPSVRWALLRKGPRGIEVERLKAICLYDWEEGKPPTAKIAIERPANVKRLYITSGLSTKDFLIRPLELKVSSQRHMEEVIAFQAEATSHFNPAEVLNVPLIQKKEKGATEALLFTVPKEALQRHLAHLEKLRIDPDAVSTIPLALCRFARWKFPHLQEALLVDLGSSETTVVLLEKGQLKRAHTIPIGVEALLSALLEDRKKILLKKEIEGAAKQIDLLLLKPALNPHLTAQLNTLRQ